MYECNVINAFLATICIFSPFNTCRRDWGYIIVILFAIVFTVAVTLVVVGIVKRKWKKSYKTNKEK